MKHRTAFLFTLLALAFALSACAAKPSPTPTLSPGDVFTQVVETLTAIAANNTPTPTVSPTDTPTVEPSPTVDLSTPTLSPTPVITPTLSKGGCDNAIFVYDVTIPDDSNIAAGQAFTKTWKIQNTGSCTWNTSYHLVFYAGTQMSGQSTALAASVNSGSETDVSVALTAPTGAGTYTSYWRMQNASGVSFGQVIYVKIVVAATTTTLTATVTSTGGPTSTVTSTSAASTSTPTPTATHTSAPTHTATVTATP